MVLSDMATYKQVLGCLMKRPVLLIEYQDMITGDFDTRLTKIIFTTIYNMFQNGATKLEPIDVDTAIINHDVASIHYKKEKGLDFLKDCYEVSKLENFEYFHDRLRKLSLLRTLKENNYNISEFWKQDFDTQREEEETIQRFENASLETILMSIEGKFNLIRTDFINGGKHSGDAATGLKDLVQELKRSPEIGPSLNGRLFSSACRGARKGKYYLRSAASGAGKTRLAVFDACKGVFPIHWSHEKGTYIIEKDMNGKSREPYKTLFITTEMAKDEIQTIVLAWISGVNEAHILTGMYDTGEEKRVMYAAEIVEKYKDSFYIEEVSDPNLTNVEAVIKRYATIEEIDAVFN